MWWILSSIKISEILTRFVTPPYYTNFFLPFSWSHLYMAHLQYLVSHNKWNHCIIFWLLPICCYFLDWCCFCLLGPYTILLNFLTQKNKKANSIRLILHCHFSSSCRFMMSAYKHLLSSNFGHQPHDIENICMSNVMALLYDPF